MIRHRRMAMALALLTLVGTGQAQVVDTWEPTLGGLPALSGSGGFLLRDLVLLAAAVWSLGEALRQAQWSITH